jgi:hypothetical protein
MGGDSCASDKYMGVSIAHPKVFMLGVPVDTQEDEPMLIGGCGAFRMMQLLEHALIVPPIGKKQSVMSWLTVEFADAVRQVFHAKGFGKGEDGQSKFNGSFLVGFRGHIYHVEDTYQSICVPDNEMCAGTGAHFAFGSLHTTRNLGWSPCDRVMAALNAAADLNLQTAGPFTYHEI